MKRIATIAVLICSFAAIAATPAFAAGGIDTGCDSAFGTPMKVTGANGHTTLWGFADVCIDNKSVTFSSRTSANHGWYLTRKWHTSWKTQPGPRGFYRAYRSVNAKFLKTGTSRWDILTITQWVRLHV
jgi:hypothetical protein